MKAAIWSPSLLWRRQGRGGKPQALAGDRRPPPTAPCSALLGSGSGGWGRGGSSLALMCVLVCPLLPRAAAP